MNVGDTRNKNYYYNIEYVTKHFISHQTAIYRDILFSLFNNTIRFIPNWPDHLPAEYYTDLAEKIYVRFFMVQYYVMTLSSWHNGYMYQIPYGIWRIPDGDGFVNPIDNMFNAICGSPEEAQIMMNIRMGLIKLFSNYPAHKLILVTLKCLVDFSLTTETFMHGLEYHSQVLVSTLDVHLKVMIERLEMGEVIANFLKICRPIFKHCLDKHSWKFE